MPEGIVYVEVFLHALHRIESILQPPQHEDLLRRQLPPLGRTFADIVTIRIENGEH
ncbi:hypothetical protein [Streptomyces boluensis]|uniref:Uncharacterized protein n=1 Tax=Streptomyces boluensis TaxID=1775135 RepID=A0A964UUT4_9ACTN|nr:hypothetical protein [Streptomyces boluensis]NBE54770.1 hypothetical protein [Streptomyces boluensis]